MAASDADAQLDELRTCESVEAGIRRYDVALSDEELLDGKSDLERNKILVYEPGNGQRYELIFTPMGWATEFLDAAGIRPGSVLVTWVNAGKSMWLAPTGFLHPDYVRKKFGCSRGTAVVLAEVFAYVLPGRSAVTCEEWRKGIDYGDGA